MVSAKQLFSLPKYKNVALFIVGKFLSNPIYFYIHYECMKNSKSFMKMDALVVGKKLPIIIFRKF